LAQSLGTKDIFEALRSNDLQEEDLRYISGIVRQEMAGTKLLLAYLMVEDLFRVSHPNYLWQTEIP
jgi:hypothetical protein